MSPSYRADILLLLAVLFTQQVVCQEIIDGMVTYNYTTDDGLPNNQVLFSMQDSEGYMWFGTGGGGAVRYDGSNFETFDISKGLHDNEVYQLFEDSDGRIWFGTFNLRFSYLENDTVKSYEHNDVIRENLRNRTILKRIHVDPDGSLYIFFHNRLTMVISKEGQLISKPQDNLGIELFLFENGDLKSSSTFTKSSKSSFYHVRESYRYIKRTINNIDSVYGSVKSPFRNAIPTLLRILPLNIDNKIILISNLEILIIDSEFKHMKSIPLKEDIGEYDVINAYSYKGKIWLLTRSGGVIIGEIEKDKFIIENQIFTEEFITTMTIDNNGGLWLTSHSNGIYHIPYPENRIIRKSNDRQIFRKNISVSENNLFAYANNQSVINIERGKDKDSIILPINEENYISDITFNSLTELLYVASNNNLYVIDPISKYIVHESERTLINQIALKRNNDILMVGGGVVSTYNEGHLYKFANRLPFNGYCINEINSRKFVGASNGFHEVTFRNDSVFLIDNDKDRMQPLLNAYVIDMTPYKNGLWIAARGIGVGFYTDSLEYQITTKEGLSSTQFLSLKQDGDTLWVSTNDGLNKIVLDSSTRAQSITIFNKNNGLSSHQISGLEVSDRDLYISTKKGIDIVPRNQLAGKEENVTLEVLGIRSLSEDGALLSPERDLSHKMNDLSIKYKAVQFNSTGKHHFRYRLLPQEQSWKSTEQSEIEYYNLEAKNYTFQVAIENNQGDWTAQDQITFNINPPFWKKIWFIILTSFIFIGSIYYYFRRREQSIRNKLLIENEMNNLKGRALRAQVNPHFIFNTLNAIQSFVLEGEFEKSNKFMTDFSRLVRLILQQSEKDLVPLSEEIDMLEMYLSLEQVRYDNKFQYTIDLDNKLAINKIHLPPMLIQPYIENAIWHGLVDDSKKGEITISFDVKDSLLTCTVQDNGIGRKASQKIKNELSHNRKSVGMSLSNDRLKVLNDSKVDFVSIEDLYSKMGLAEGTKVIINIPRIKNEQSENYHR